MLTSATFRYLALGGDCGQVDSMSGGRVELGLGAGWYEEDTWPMASLPPVAERFERLEEQLAIVSGLWETRWAAASRSKASTTS